MPIQCCVILLNWNGWRDTTECLESLLRLSGPSFRIIVCDNGSTDGSMEKLRQWTRGELVAPCTNPQLAHLSSPPVPKPVPFLELTREQAESGRAPHGARLVFIQTGANLGFAGGNNVGLRYALSDPALVYFWLLNNDTVAAPGALEALVKQFEQQPALGLCGSLNLSYHSPDEVQAEGGKRYDCWTGRVRNEAKLTVQQLSLQPSTTKPAQIDFVIGASMMASRAFLEQIGLMEESYFLYFEELDWAMRARGKFSLGYARGSVIHHKEGASIGSHAERSKRSLACEKYLSRNRVLFTRRYFPYALPTVLPWAMLAAAYRALRGNRPLARTLLASMWEGATVQLGRPK